MQCAVHKEPDIRTGRIEALVRTALGFRRRRAEKFGSDLFANPTWDIILNLTVAPLGGLSVEELADLTQRSEESTRRWLKFLMKRGHVTDNGSDRFRITTEAVGNLFALVPFLDDLD